MTINSTKWVLGLWLSVCLAIMLFMSMQQLVEYDPRLKLSNAIADTSFEQRFVKALQLNLSVPSSSVIHFTNDNCFCQLVASEHIQSLSNKLLNEGFQNIHINLQQQPNFKEFIPATPSVAIIGEKQELIYLGPYSEGYGCLTGTSLVDNVISKISTIELENTVFITEAKGCYCQS